MVSKAVVVKAAVGFVDVTRLLDGLVQQSRPGNHRFSVCSLSAIARAACDARLGCASVAAGLLDLDSFGHDVFSFSAPLLAGHPKVGGTPAPCGCLGGGAKKISLVSLDFLGWDRPPRAAKLKQSLPTVGRRSFCHPAVPARRRSLEKGE